ncbi:MAG: peptidylprolyl isomerase [Burkholderiales bacterium]
MRNKASIYGLVSVLALAAGAGLSPRAGRAQGAENVVARLGNAELNSAEFKRLLDAQPAEARTQLLSNRQLLDRFVRTEMLKRALVEEAKAKGFDRRPDVAEAMERARDQALVTQYVSEQARPAANYPSEQEVAEAYRANSNEFTVPAQYRVSQIFLSTGEGAQKKDAEAVRKRIDELAKIVAQKPAEFESVARRQSEHSASAEQGGDMGWVPLEQMVPEVRALVAEMKKGDVGKPVRTVSGWHIVKLADIKPKSLKPMAEVREYIVRALRLRKAQENEQKYLDDMVARTPLGVNEIALNRLIAPQVSAAPVPEKKP